LNIEDEMLHQLSRARLQLVNTIEATPVTINRLRSTPEARDMAEALCCLAEKCRAAVTAITNVIGDEKVEEHLP
jgi:hypothetical protein